MRDDEVFIGRFSAIDALGSKTSDPRLFGCSVIYVTVLHLKH
jgi:hypothetical protein